MRPQRARQFRRKPNYTVENSTSTDQSVSESGKNDQKSSTSRKSLNETNTQAKTPTSASKQSDEKSFKFKKPNDKFKYSTSKIASPKNDEADDPVKSPIIFQRPSIPVRQYKPKKIIRKADGGTIPTLTFHSQSAEIKNINHLVDAAYEEVKNPKLCRAAKKRLNRKKRKEELRERNKIEKEEEIRNQKNNETNNENIAPKFRTYSNRRRQNNTKKDEKLSKQQSATKSFERKTEIDDCCCLSKLANGWQSDPTAGPSNITSTTDECYTEFLIRSRSDSLLLMMRKAWDDTCEAMQESSDPSAVIHRLLVQIKKLVGEQEKAAEFLKTHTHGNTCFENKIETSVLNSQLEGKTALNSSIKPDLVSTTVQEPAPTKTEVLKPELFFSGNDDSDESDMPDDSDVPDYSDVPDDSEDICDPGDSTEVDEDYSIANRNQLLYNYIWGDDMDDSVILKISHESTFEILSEVDWPMSIKDVLIYHNPKFINIRYGIGILLVKNLQYAITTREIIKGFGTYGQVLYYAQRTVRTDRGLKDMLGVVYKTRLHALVAARNLNSQFDEDEGFTLITSSSSMKDQQDALEFLGVAYNYRRHDIVPFNTLKPDTIEDAVENFQKVLYIYTS